MRTLDKTAWEILNATADDCENLEQIYRSICFEIVPDDAGTDHNPQATAFRPVRGAPYLHELAGQIRELMDAGLLAPVMDEDGGPIADAADPSCVWRAWFRMTSEGQRVWDSSEFGKLVEHE